jgi:OOP family OmpA-OmpF porin
VARALKADPNAVLELQGFADQRGTDRYNYQLTRDRVDAVVRYLVQRHGIDLRRIHAVGMGKATLAAGEKRSKETFAKSRRVEMRLLAPQS